MWFLPKFVLPSISGHHQQLQLCPTHGLAEYIAQEEMDQKTGFWWSLESKYIAFTQVDASKIPLFRIVEDNRGTTRRGLKFEGSLKYNVGCIDAEDQLIGVEWLIKQGLARARRLGLCGWSYGGYLSAMALARFPEMFWCAMAGALVTVWDGYDTFYIEKYMGLPSESLASYEYSSFMHHVHKIKGNLLLVHGMIDENMHFRHTARLVNAVVVARKPYELLVFPDECHMPRRLRD